MSTWQHSLTQGSGEPPDWPAHLTTMTASQEQFWLRHLDQKSLEPATKMQAKSPMRAWLDSRVLFRRDGASHAFYEVLGFDPDSDEEWDRIKPALYGLGEAARAPALHLALLADWVQERHPAAFVDILNEVDEIDVAPLMCEGDISRRGAALALYAVDPRLLIRVLALDRLYRFQPSRYRLFPAHRQQAPTDWTAALLDRERLEGCIKDWTNKRRPKLRIHDAFQLKSNGSIIVSLARPVGRRGRERGEEMIETANLQRTVLCFDNDEKLRISTPAHSLMAKLADIIAERLAQPKSEYQNDDDPADADRIRKLIKALATDNDDAMLLQSIRIEAPHEKGAVDLELYRPGHSTLAEPLDRMGVGDALNHPEAVREARIDFREREVQLIFPQSDDGGLVCYSSQHLDLEGRNALLAHVRETYADLRLASAKAGKPREKKKRKMSPQELLRSALHEGALLRDPHPKDQKWLERMKAGHTPLLDFDWAEFVNCGAEDYDHGDSHCTHLVRLTCSEGWDALSRRNGVEPGSPNWTYADDRPRDLVSGFYRPCRHHPERARELLWWRPRIRRYLVKLNMPNVREEVRRLTVSAMQVDTHPHATGAWLLLNQQRQYLICAKDWGEEALISASALIASPANNVVIIWCGHRSAIGAVNLRFPERVYSLADVIHGREPFLRECFRPREHAPPLPRPADGRRRLMVTEEQGRIRVGSGPISAKWGTAHQVFWILANSLRASSSAPPIPWTVDALVSRLDRHGSPSIQSIKNQIAKLRTPDWMESMGWDVQADGDATAIVETGEGFWLNPDIFSIGNIGDEVPPRGNPKG